MQSEMAATAGLAFRQLNDADLKFGAVKNERGENVELSHSMFNALLDSPDGDVRRNAFDAYYKQYHAYRHTLAATLKGTIENDIYYRQGAELSFGARSGPVSRSGAGGGVRQLDRVGPSAASRLVPLLRRAAAEDGLEGDPLLRHLRADSLGNAGESPVGRGGQAGHRRRRACWGANIAACSKPDEGPLVRPLREPRQGEPPPRARIRTSPISSSTTSPPCSTTFSRSPTKAATRCNSYLSSQTQPYVYYQYPIFVAEVASTFNEQLLGKYLMEHARDKQERAAILNRQIDVAPQDALPPDHVRRIRETRPRLGRVGRTGDSRPLDGYLPRAAETLLRAGIRTRRRFGPGMPAACRISTGDFHVYKYATSVSASMALAERVLGGGPKELNDYSSLLKGGCSKDPLDLLRGAGVDMEKPDRVDSAFARFGEMVKELQWADLRIRQLSSISQRWCSRLRFCLFRYLRAPVNLEEETAEHFPETPFSRSSLR